MASSKHDIFNYLSCNALDLNVSLHWRFEMMTTDIYTSFRTICVRLRTVFKLLYLNKNSDAYISRLVLLFKLMNSIQRIRVKLKVI